MGGLFINMIKNAIFMIMSKKILIFIIIVLFLTCFVFVYNYFFRQTVQAPIGNKFPINNGFHEPTGPPSIKGPSGLPPSTP